MQNKHLWWVLPKHADRLILPAFISFKYEIMNKKTYRNVYKVLIISIPTAGER